MIIRQSRTQFSQVDDSVFTAVGMIVAATQLRCWEPDRRFKSNRLHFYSLCYTAIDIVSWFFTAAQGLTPNQQQEETLSRTRVQ